MGPYTLGEFYFFGGFMDVKNRKYLDANTYDSISICKNINVSQVRTSWANGGTGVPLEHVGNRFTQELKKMTDEEKVNEIIRHFLRNNTIYEIINECHSCVMYTVIKALGDRSLRISERHTLSKEILDEIYFKYNIDRGKIADTSSCDNYIFGVADWCSCERIIPRDYYYMIPSTMHNQECMDICFIEDEKDISDIDKRFFSQIISDLIGEDGCKIIDYVKYYVIYRKDGRKIQILLSSANKYMEDVMKNYVIDIKEENKEKRLQKKMEGFI